MYYIGFLHIFRACRFYPFFFLENRKQAQRGYFSPSLPYPIRDTAETMYVTISYTYKVTLQSLIHLHRVKGKSSEQKEQISLTSEAYITVEGDKE